jgi:hypothetical protein
MSYSRRAGRPRRSPRIRRPRPEQLSAQQAPRQRRLLLRDAYGGSRAAARHTHRSSRRLQCPWQYRRFRVDSLREHAKRQGLAPRTACGVESTHENTEKLSLVSLALANDFPWIFGCCMVCRAPCRPAPERPGEARIREDRCRTLPERQPPIGGNDPGPGSVVPFGHSCLMFVSASPESRQAKPAHEYWLAAGPTRLLASARLMPFATAIRSAALDEPPGRAALS